MRHIRLFAILFAVFATSALAGGCETEIQGNDAMLFNLRNIDVSKSCKTFTVNLVHTGKVPKAAMGHNWVLSKTADVDAVANDAIGAGLKNDYIKPNDTRIIAYTRLIGGGEKTSVTFAVSKLKAGESYTYICSFPGHAGRMRGTLRLVG